MSHPSIVRLPWWATAVVYQIYIRSFADGNGDGIGDIAGIRRRLDYLADLGVDAIWITPWYPSPLKDGGYDVSDYRDIDPRFGSLDEADGLIADAHERGLRVIIDIVPNHTSDQHAWFQEALKAPPGDPARDRYIIRRGKGALGELPPNDWESVFTGPAWDRLPDGSWYLHLFDSSQPDLNWDNAEVNREFLDIFTFWLERGVDGIRVDVAHGLVKDPRFPDLGQREDLLEQSNVTDHPYWDRDGVHPIIRSWRAVLDRYQGRMMVAEAWVPPERLPLYLRPGEYHQSFNFNLLDAQWDAAAFRDVVKRSVASLESVGASPTWVLSNHDVMRAATRYGLPNDTNWRKWPLDGPHDALDADLGLERARALAVVLLALPGSAYIYQGEELGLPEVWNLPDDVLDDPHFERSGRTEKGRDGCRVPMPWTPNGPSFGFGEGQAWLPQPPEYGERSAATQASRTDSMLALYRRALALRPRLFTQDVKMTIDEDHPTVFSFRRGSGVRCVVNMGEEPVMLPPGRILLASGNYHDDRLEPDSAVWWAPPARQ